MNILLEYHRDQIRSLLKKTSSIYPQNVTNLVHMQHLARSPDQIIDLGCKIGANLRDREDKELTNYYRKVLDFLVQDELHHGELELFFDLAGIKYHRAQAEGCQHCGHLKMTSVGNKLYICSKCYSLNDRNKSDFVAADDLEITPVASSRLEYYDGYVDKLELKKIPFISDEIMAKIRELATGENKSTKGLSVKDIRRYLKTLRLREYYYDVTYILNKLNCLIPPGISQRDRETMQIMFREFECVWPSIKPPDRKSFSSYPYLGR